MRILHDREAYLLQINIERDQISPDELDMDHENKIFNLTERGYVNFELEHDPLEPDNPWRVWQTTRLGKEALKCYQAFKAYRG